MFLCHFSYMYSRIERIERIPKIVSKYVLSIYRYDRLALSGKVLFAGALCLNIQNKLKLTNIHCVFLLKLASLRTSNEISFLNRLPGMFLCLHTCICHCS